MYYTPPNTKLANSFFWNSCDWDYPACHIIMDRTALIALLIIVFSWNTATKCVNGECFLFWQQKNDLLRWLYSFCTRHKTLLSHWREKKFKIWVNTDTELWVRCNSRTKRKTEKMKIDALCNLNRLISIGALCKKKCSNSYELNWCTMPHHNTHIIIIDVGNRS